MRVIALDLASVTGFAVGSSCRVESSGHLDCRLGKGTGKFTGESFYDFYRWLSNLIEEQLGRHKEIITLIYERPLCNFYNTVRIAHGLAAIVQMMEGSYLDEVIVNTDVPPATIKKYWTGSGRADKADMIAQAQREGYDVTDDNEADAIALYHYSQEVLFGGK